jgi:non-specific serine/threonine protein kinase
LAQALVLELPWESPRTACFVDLAPVDDPQAVPASIAQALGVQESGREPLRAILQHVIGRSPVLLVLDNFERVTPAAAFLADLLSEAPDLVCLVTSREPLHIRAEHVFPVGPLPVPDANVTDPAALSATPSVALFVDRGRGRQPDFRLTVDNAPAVAEICRRLDGLPLAIELAAAQVSVLSPPVILGRYLSREPFVLDVARDLPARQRTLRATVEWSYDLLDPGEQLVFRRCGVFSGTFDVAAVAALMDRPAAPGPLPALARLVDVSLIQLQLDAPAGYEPRFRMLETIRAIALELLTESDESNRIRRQHAEHFVGLAERIERTLIGAQMAEALDELEREYDNLRSVLYWAVDDRGDVALGLRLAGALNRFWMLRGHLDEARQWMDRALPAGGDLAPEIRAKALNAAGVLAGLQGDGAAAETFFRESLALWESLGDEIRMAAAMGNLGLVAQDRHDVNGALEWFIQAEALYAAGGDRRGVAVSLGSRAHLARQQGQTQEALELFDKALRLFREVADPRGTANCLANLGFAMVALRRPAHSSRYFGEALQLRRSLGTTVGIAECLEGFAAVAAAKRRGRRAARLLGAASAMREISGAPLPATERKRHEAVFERIGRQLTPEALAREQAIGRALTVDQAADYALAFASASDNLPSGSENRRTPVLSKREREVATLVAQGMTNREIAATLLLTRRTIGTHLEHIFSKLGVQARAEVAVWISRHERD